jgi:anthranilate/para-aminobenzoate synthase component II
MMQLHCKKLKCYHSLIVSQNNLPDTLQVAAHCEAGEVMALKHREYHIYGVQFHPESVLTQQGHKLLQDFLKILT